MQAEVAQRVVAIDGLPWDPLAACQIFFAEHLPRIEQELSGCDALLILLPFADFTHSEWRRSATRSLARQHTPKRINMIAADDAATITAMTDYCARAPGVTGQYLPAHKTGEYV